MFTQSVKVLNRQLFDFEKFTERPSKILIFFFFHFAYTSISLFSGRLEN